MNLSPAMLNALTNHRNGVIIGARAQTLNALEARGLTDDCGYLTPAGYEAIGEDETAAVLADPDTMAAIDEAQSEPVNGAELPADGPNDEPEGKDTGDVLPIPHHVAMAIAAMARGEYGDEARRLVRDMDDRDGERMTRWVARLRHKLNSAGLTDAANAIRLVA